MHPTRSIDHSAARTTAAPLRLLSAFQPAPAQVAHWQRQEAVVTTTPQTLARSAPALQRQSLNDAPRATVAHAHGGPLAESLRWMSPGERTLQSAFLRDLRETGALQSVWALRRHRAAMNTILRRMRNLWGAEGIRDPRELARVRPDLFNALMQEVGQRYERPTCLRLRTWAEGGNLADATMLRTRLNARQTEVLDRYAASLAAPPTLYAAGTVHAYRQRVQAALKRMMECHVDTPASVADLRSLIARLRSTVDLAAPHYLERFCAFLERENIDLESVLPRNGGPFTEPPPASAQAAVATCEPPRAAYAETAESEQQMLENLLFSDIGQPGSPAQGSPPAWVESFPWSDDSANVARRDAELCASCLEHLRACGLAQTTTQTVDIENAIMCLVAAMRGNPDAYGTDDPRALFAANPSALDALLEAVRMAGSHSSGTMDLIYAWAATGARGG